jgi:glycolate oxidase FAD binding subunit
VGATELRTSGLARIVEHNAGDLTAVLEAGVPLADAQAAFAQAGQMLALDPPGDGATIGGVLATNDSGPLRHRYGSARDVVLGAAVALSDGTLSRSGGKVIKNVAGYDVAKLFCGSFGTLGVIAEVSVRLHPRPAAHATALGETDDPVALAAAAAALARRPLEADCLDATWSAGAGRLLARFSGATASDRAGAVAGDMALDGASVVEDDEPLWSAQRAAQRSDGGAVLKVSARPGDLPVVLSAAEAVQGRVVARAALGLAWIAIEGDDLARRIGSLRDALAPRACTLLDAPQEVRAAVSPWPDVEPGALEVMRRLKARFDPARVCAPGSFVGGL